MSFSDFLRGRRQRKSESCLAKAIRCHPPKKALPLTERATRLDSRSHEAWMFLGDLYRVHFKRYEDALKCYDRAIELYKEAVPVTFDDSDANGLAGIVQAMQRAKDRLDDLGVDRVIALNNKGIVYEAMGKFEEAINCYDLILEFEKDSDLGTYQKNRVLKSLGRL